MEKVQSQLEADGLHVRLLERRGDVHVHVQEVAHHSVLLGLLNFQLGQELDEPLKRFLIPVNPEKVHLKEMLGALQLRLRAICLGAAPFSG